MGSYEFVIKKKKSSCCKFNTKLLKKSVGHEYQAWLAAVIGYDSCYVGEGGLQPSLSLCLKREENLKIFPKVSLPQKCSSGKRRKFQYFQPHTIKYF